MSEKSLILIVDDEPVIQDTLAALLDESQFRLEFASTGEQALEMAEKLLPNVILLDVMLPGIDGYQVCRQLRKNTRLAEVPIVMLTALDDRDAKLTGLLAGADDFLGKPFDSLELKIRLRTILQLNRYGRLVAERARFSWIVERAEDGYLLLNTDGEIQYANARAQNFLHLAEQYQGVHFVHQVEKFYTPHPTEKWDGWLAESTPLYLVHPETSHARPFWLLMESLDAADDQPNNRVVHLCNITEQMATYHDMRKFHTAITHKLRTPVSLIYGAMSLLETKIDHISPEEVKPMVMSAWKGVQRLADIVRDVLTYIDAPLSLNIGGPATVTEFVELVAKTAEMLNLENVTYSLPPELAQTRLSLTSFSLELILEELFENSKKFHPRHAPHVEIRIEQITPKQIRFSVKDDGLTLTAEQLSWAWLPYFQSEKFFSGEAPGMGLGFPLVATLIWQAGGNIRLSNRPDGPGIVVALTVPLSTK